MRRPSSAVSKDAGVDQIEDYLDRLLAELRGGAGDVRRILAETEGHLRDAVDAAVADGLTLSDAQRQALERFGPPRTIARRFAATEDRMVPIGVLIQLVLAVALIGGIGLIAVGASAGLAGAMEVAAGKSFVAGDASGVTYTPARCADFFEYFPHASSCEAAATDHHYDEVITYRSAAGVLGLVVLAGYFFTRRRRPQSVGMLPEGFVATVGATVFGVGGALLVGQGVGEMTAGGDGAGNALSGGIVAVLVAGAFAIALYRTLVRTSVRLTPSDP